MRIEFLNVWSGRQGELLTKYLAEEAKNVDVFCFQEADKFFPRIATEALGKQFDFQTGYKYVDRNDIFPQAVYFRKGIRGTTRNLLQETPDVGLGIEYTVNGFNIANFHGVSRPGNKLDSENRIKQSEQLIREFCSRGGTTVIWGDFNLDNETISVSRFKEAGYRDLISEFEIRTTRNRLVWEKFPNTPQYHSDYVFVSPEVKVKNFEVINNEVSDHLPMILEIED